jgi:GntR family transcriptional regulator
MGAILSDKVRQGRARQGTIGIPAGKDSLTLPYLARVEVDHGSPTPAYVQLAEIIRSRIAAGEWSRGPLPSNRAFQETYGVGEYVVTRAIRVLEEEGLVFTVPRRGAYVRQRS